MHTIRKRCKTVTYVTETVTTYILKKAPFHGIMLSKKNITWKGAVIMKIYEKVLTAVFGFGIAAFITDFIIEVMLMDVEADYQFFWGITAPLAVYFSISLLGLMRLLVKVHLRKRTVEGKEPISKNYKLSFILSFIPFLMVVINSAASGDFNFMGTTVSTGMEVFWDHLFFTGVLYLGCVIPIFPVLLFWQLLYIVNRIKYRKKKAVSSK